MPSANSLVIAGHLGRDAKTGMQKNDKKYAFFSVAITEKYGENETTTWVNCKWFNAFSNVDEWLTKGRGVTIIGKLAVDQPRDGEKRGEMFVRVDQCIPYDSSFSRKRESRDDRPMASKPVETGEWGGATSDDVPFALDNKRQSWF